MPETDTVTVETPGAAGAAAADDAAEREAEQRANEFMSKRSPAGSLHAPSRLGGH